MILHWLTCIIHLGLHSWIMFFVFGVNFGYFTYMYLDVSYYIMMYHIISLYIIVYQCISMYINEISYQNGLISYCESYICMIYVCISPRCLIMFFFFFATAVYMHVVHVLRRLSFHPLSSFLGRELLGQQVQIACGMGCSQFRRLILCTCTCSFVFKCATGW